MSARLVMLFVAATLSLLSFKAMAVDVNSAVLRVDYPSLLPISRFDRQQDDFAFAGAALADEDNNTTGSFLGHVYETKTVATTPEEAEAALGEILKSGTKLVVILARTEELLRLTDQAAEAGALVFNAANADTSLRDDQCRANLLHIAPSNAMNADAVAQFAMWKRWSDWFLVSGGNAEGQVIADAYRRSAEKFGANIVEDRIFEDTGGARRTDSGHVLVQKQIPTDTQNVDDHDIVIAADGTDFFARYLPYHVWTSRLVMGSSGLRPVTMHGSHEAWGSTQYQTRFEELNGRYVKPEDYNVWLALRVVGEAVTRVNTATPEGVRDYALSEAFELAAFKGQKVTFRTWNGQLRQPILLYDGSITVSVSPQEGFLHQHSVLDTLGLDQPESNCTAFN